MKDSNMNHAYEDFIRRAYELGATDAKIIKTSSVVTAAWVRLRCQYGCERYNSSHCCPPKSPTPGETREILDGYENALFIHCIGDVNTNSIVKRLEREIFLSGFHKTVGMTAGPCTICKKCNQEKCNNPNIARPAMEACGIDVFATARGNGFPIEVVKDRTSPQNYYALILIE